MKNFLASLFKTKSKVSEQSVSTLSPNNRGARDAYIKAQSLIENGNEQNEYLLSLLDLSIQGGFTKAYESRAFCLRNLGFHHEAIVDFDKVINSSTTDSNLYFSRGHSKSIVGDFGGAIRDIGLAISNTQIDSELNKEYNDEMSKSGWGSATQFYEHQLNDILNKHESSQKPHLKEIFLKRIASVKRRTDG